jgi:TolB-like protein/Tfp pilus assembly protein PilF
MPSLLPGFEYDIFISYRQKDNKGDRWVSEFVEALRTELESTFKEEISVYFDISPHDGLLETHDVDATLKEKLKCLVFIPVISRTYCDPKSFAWENEFKAFIDQASRDQFGLKVKLPNGNVATRVLPIQIHDLHPEDKLLLEKELGGVLRAIEFIYKEQGVNRPLTSNDDKEVIQGRPKYRNQVNKVANAIDEIIGSLKERQNSQAIGKLSSGQTSLNSEENISKKLSETTLINQYTKKWTLWLLSFILFFIVAFAVLKIIESYKKNIDITRLEKSIAVLPFVNDSPDQANTYFINGIMEEILNNLQKIKDFRVLSRTSTEQYRSSNKPAIPKIAKNLKVNYIVEGSGQKYGDKFVLRVQLLAAENEKHLWGESFERLIKETSDIIELQNQIAKTIAEKLKASITPEERDLIDKSSTKNLAAYDFYQQGNEEYRKFETENDTLALKRARILFSKSLQNDSSFARAYLGLADIYSGRNWNRLESYYSETYFDTVLLLANKALSFDDKLAEAYAYRANYFVRAGNTKQAIREYEKALKYNPNFGEVYIAAAWNVYASDKEYSDFVKAIEYCHKAVGLNRGEDLADLLRNLGGMYSSTAGFHDEARHYYEEAFKIDNDSTRLIFELGYLELSFGNFEEAIRLLRKNYTRDSTDSPTRQWLGFAYLFTDQYNEPLKLWNNFIRQLKAKGEFIQGSMLRFGLAYWGSGDKKEAEYWFNEQLKFCEKSIELNRSYSKNYAYYDIAATCAILGQKDKALDNLRKFSTNGLFTQWILMHLKYDPLLDNLRKEPEFQQIVKDIESKFQAEHERVRIWLEAQGKM